ncbi:hypothetical protein ACJX0J_019544 [Zea mays]
MLDLWGYYLEVYFVQDPLLSDRKGFYNGFLIALEYIYTSIIHLMRNFVDEIQSKQIRRLYLEYHHLIYIGLLQTETASLEIVGFLYLFLLGVGAIVFFIDIMFH